MYMPASPRQRATSAIASAAIVAGLAALLVHGLQVRFKLPGRDDFVAIGIAPERKPEPEPPPRKATSSAPKGSPSPKNLRNKATPVVAPTTPALIVPPPIVAAPVPGPGSAANTGASDQRGPGQGAGGIGDGLGGGGTGGNGDGEAVVGPRQIRGRLSIDDLEEGRLQPGEEASVGVVYKVNVDGRVSDCKVRRRSGYRDIDALACQLIERRFVYRPARDRNGDPVASWVGETHTWFERMDGRR